MIELLFVINFLDYQNVLSIMEKVEARNYSKILKKELVINEILLKSYKYGIQPELLAAILAVESEFVINAHNKKSGDYGMGQINYKVAKSLGLKLDLLLTNASYNIDASANVLAMKRRFIPKEPNTWYCRYNVGTAPLYRVKNNCVKYLNKIRYYLKYH